MYNNDNNLIIQIPQSQVIDNIPVEFQGIPDRIYNSGEFLKLSLKGFNGSPYCNKTSAETFLESYMTRKEVEILRRLKAYPKKGMNVDQLHVDIFLYQLCISKRDFIIEYINKNFIEPPA